MENSDDCHCSESSDDGSVVIECLCRMSVSVSETRDENDKIGEQINMDQEVEVASREVVVRNLDGSIINGKNTKPDSSDETSKNNSDLQNEKLESAKEDIIEVTSSESNVSSLLGNEEVLETDLVSSTTAEKINTRDKPSSNEEVTIVWENKLEKDKPMLVPTHILKKLIAKEIVSSPEGFAAVEDLQKCVIKKFPRSRRNLEFLKKIIMNTLENNSDTFMPHIIKKEDTYESGFWILRPLAAATFLYEDILEKHKKCPILEKDNLKDDRKINSKPVVQIRKLPTVDIYAPKNKIMKIESVIMPSSNVLETLKEFGVSFATKWDGLSTPDKKIEDKISKLQEIIKSYGNPTKSCNSAIKGNETIIQDSIVADSHPTLSVSTSKGIKRIRLSDSCSDLETSDSEIPPNGSIVHKEHNYVASANSSGSKNLIENLRKIVQKMDKGCDKKPLLEKHRLGSKNQDEEEEFLGFDYDFPSGYWRGWEKASSKNAEKMKEIIRRQEGSRDLEQVLKESYIAVTKCLEELESLSVRNEVNVQNLKPCDLNATIQRNIKALMALFDMKLEEPPVTYLGLTVMAICASPEPAAVTVEDICHFIQHHFPFHRRESLQGLVEVILHRSAVFSCQKTRRPPNAATYWRVDATSACDILSRELQFVEMRNKAARSPLKPPSKVDILSESSLKKETKEDRMATHNEPSTRKSQPGVIVDAKSLQSPSKPCQTVDLSNKSSLTNVNDLNQGYRQSPTLTQISPAKSNENKSLIKDSNNSVVVSPVPVILSVDSYRESSKVKKNITHPCSPKKLESLDKINVMRSPCNYTEIYEEDQELEIVDIDPCLLEKGNSRLSSEDDDVIVVEDDAEQIHNNSSYESERSFSNEQSSFANESTNEVCNRTSDCLFLKISHNLGSENKKYPCYICHKFYMSHEVLQIHFAQTHFDKENIHVTSALCHNRKRNIEPNSINKSVKKMVLISPENSFSSEIIGPRPSVENILHDLQSKPFDGVIRYSCSKCVAIFHEQETLDLHILVHHKDNTLRSIMPLQHVLKQEGNRLFYYCKQCSGCFDTEKAFDVHKCAPFPGSLSPST